MTPSHRFNANSLFKNDTSDIGQYGCLDGSFASNQKRGIIERVRIHASSPHKHAIKRRSRAAIRSTKK